MDQDRSRRDDSWGQRRQRLQRFHHRQRRDALPLQAGRDQCRRRETSSSTPAERSSGSPTSRFPNTAGLTLNGGGTINLNGFTETVGSFTDNGGTTILGGGNLFSGSDLIVGDGSVVGVTSSVIGNVIYNGIATTATISGAINLPNNTPSHSFIVNDGLSSRDLLVTGAVTGTSDMLKTGPGVLEFNTGANIVSFSGNITRARERCASRAEPWRRAGRSSPTAESSRRPVDKSSPTTA